MFVTMASSHSSATQLYSWQPLQSFAGACGSSTDSPWRSALTWRDDAYNFAYGILFIPENPIKRDEVTSERPRETRWRQVGWLHGPCR